MDEDNPQDDIRERHQEISEEITGHENDISALENELGELQAQCTHPNMGKGKDYHGWGVTSNECPDCGFIKE